MKKDSNGKFLGTKLGDKPLTAELTRVHHAEKQC